MQALDFIHALFLELPVNLANAVVELISVMRTVYPIGVGILETMTMLFAIYHALNKYFRKALGLPLENQSVTAAIQTVEVEDSMTQTHAHWAHSRGRYYYGYTSKTTLTSRFVNKACVVKTMNFMSPVQRSYQILAKLQQLVSPGIVNNPVEKKVFEDAFYDLRQRLRPGPEQAEQHAQGRAERAEGHPGD